MQWFHKVIADHLDMVLDGKIKKLMIFVPPQHGKQISDSVLVPTPSGFKKHGDLKVGDLVYGRFGYPVKVTGVSKKAISEYDVTFNDGQVIQCHGNHEWVVFDRSYRKECKLETKYLVTQKLDTGTPSKRGHRYRFQLDTNVALQNNDAPLVIEPYVLGAWLGDGKSSAGVLFHHEEDLSVAEKIANYGYELGAVLRHKDTGVISTTFLGLQAKLNKINVFNNKHIPEEYFNSSVEQRLELLAGLIDTDGYIYHKTGRVTFSNANKQLIDDVKRLVISLGCKVTICSFDPILSTSGIQGRQVVYQLGFNPTFHIPCALERKKTIDIKPKVSRRSIISIKKSVNPEQGNCIEVEGGIYLVGETAIPTHNSELSTRSFPAYALGKKPHLKIALTSYNATLAEQFSSEIQRRITSEEYKALFPSTRIGEKKGEAIRTAEFFQTVGFGGYIKAVGRGGSLVGTAVDLGIIDDPLKDRQEAQSNIIKEQLWNWYTDVFETRLHNDSAQVLIQTRWYDDDLAGRLLERDDDWTIIEFPALREKAENSYDMRKEGEALWEARHSAEKLLKVKKNEPFTFESLYQQNPKPSSESLVYHDWQPCEFFPKDADVIFSGLDFGFSNDPTALVRIAKIGNKLYLDEVIYEKGLTNADLIKKIQMYPEKLGEIYADSADPKSIEELRRAGVRIVKAVKGNDSVTAGISKLREYEVYYTRRSKNIKKETDNYQWLTIGGKPINKPIDDFNHCFVGDTMIYIGNGSRYKFIDEIKVGDYVLTRNGLKKVLLTHNNGLKKVRTYIINKDQFVNCTDNHRFMINGDWKEINNIKVGDYIICDSQIEGIGNHLVSDLYISELWNAPVYDLTIEDEHEYYANGFLVHNCMDSVRYAVYTKYSKKKLLIF